VLLDSTTFRKWKKYTHSLAASPSRYYLLKPGGRYGDSGDLRWNLVGISV